MFFEVARPPQILKSALPGGWPKRKQVFYDYFLKHR